MTYRNILWASVVVLLAAAAIGLIAVHGRIKVSLTQSEVQERINRQIDRDFPVHGSAAVLVKSATLKDASVVFEDGQAIVSFDVEGTLRTDKTFSLTASAVGGPHYSSGAFYFKPETLTIDRIAYQGSSPTEAVDTFAHRHVRSERLRKMIDGKAHRFEEWAVSIAEHAATRALMRRPIYQPKDDVTGYVIRASLESVAIVDDRLVITFSLWQLTMSVAIGLFCLIAAIALVIALLEFPLLGAALVFTSFT